MCWSPSMLLGTNWSSNSNFWGPLPQRLMPVKSYTEWAIEQIAFYQSLLVMRWWLFSVYGWRQDGGQYSELRPTATIVQLCVNIELSKLLMQLSTWFQEAPDAISTKFTSPFWCMPWLLPCLALWSTLSLPHSIGVGGLSHSVYWHLLFLQSCAPLSHLPETCKVSTNSSCQIWNLSPRTFFLVFYLLIHLHSNWFRVIYTFW